jgi:sugar-specific transcriptional regulator TrmB
MNLNNLEQLGLTNNEIKIYSFLLKKESSTTGPIIDSLSLSSSRVYASLQELIKKSLVSYYLKNNTNYYRAESPDNLIKLAEEIKSNISPIVEELKQIKKEEQKEEFSAIYEGYLGFKQAFQLLLKETSKKEEILTIGFSPFKQGFTTVRNYLRNVDHERYKKKIPMRILLDINMKDTIGKDREKEPYTEVKYLPKGYITPSALSIFKDYVIHWVWKENPTTFVIRNKEINESFRNYFNLLWKMAKK